MTIYPAILTDILETAQEQVDLVAGAVPVVQFDYIDANFAEETTLTPSELQSVDFRGLQADIHIMASDPLNELAEVETLGTQVRAVIAQVEHMPSQRAFVDEVKLGNWRVGLSLDVFTPVSAIDDDVWNDLHIIQLMGVEAGKQGQQFSAAVLKKIFDVREQISSRGLHTELIVDGGMNLATIPQCKKAGADAFAVGSALWTSAEPAATLKELQDLA